MTCSSMLTSLEVCLSLIGNRHSSADIDLSEWTSGNESLVLDWNTTQTSSGMIYHTAQRKTYQSMEEINDVAEGGTVYLSTSSVCDQSGIHIAID